MTPCLVPPAWTPAQAFAVYELLRALERTVWDTYRLDIQKVYRQ
jgi:hypothetical protein